MQSVVTDPRMGAVSFSVVRKSYVRSLGETVPQRSETFTAVGSVHPAASEDLQLLPEELRGERVIVIFTPFALSLGGNTISGFTAPDEVLYGGEAWRVVRLKDWSMFGFVQGWAIRQRR